MRLSTNISGVKIQRPLVTHYSDRFLELFSLVQPDCRGFTDAFQPDFIDSYETQLGILKIEDDQTLRMMIAHLMLRTMQSWELRRLVTGI